MTARRLLITQSCGGEGGSSYLRPVALQRLLQLGLGGGGLLLVGLAQVFDGRGVDVVELRAQGGCGEIRRSEMLPV